MATVRHNVMVERLGSMLGDQLVFKKDKAGRTIISYKPTFDENRTFSEAQTAQQEAFREAIAYGKSAKDNSVYAEKAQGTTLSPFNVATADYLHEPQTLDVDISGWHGETGQVIRVKALDNVQVKEVTVVITDESGAAVLEQGEATSTDGLWRLYTTTQAASRHRLAPLGLLAQSSEAFGGHPPQVEEHDLERGN